MGPFSTILQRKFLSIVHPDGIASLEPIVLTPALLPMAPPFVFSLLLKKGEQPRHGQFPVEVLGALLLGEGAQTRGQVRHPHRGFGFVGVLPARAGGSHVFDAQFIVRP